jgi:hypothetical protein
MGCCFPLNGRIAWNDSHVLDSLFGENLTSYFLSQRQNQARFQHGTTQTRQLGLIASRAHSATEASTASMNGSCDLANIHERVLDLRKDESFAVLRQHCAQIS